MADLLSGQGTFTDYLVHKWLQEFAANCWVSLHFDSPAIAGSLASEFAISSGGYHRVRCTFSEPSNRVIWNNNTLQWKGLAANRLLYVGGWDARENGRLLFWEKLPNVKRIRAGSGHSIAPNKLAISFA